MARTTTSVVRAAAAWAILMLLTPLGLVTALQVSPNSPCADVCIDDAALNRSDPGSSTTVGRRDIVCEDRQMNVDGTKQQQSSSSSSSSSVGMRFRQCMACLERSAFEQDGESDQQWFLYNMRYAVDFCVFGFPNGTGAGSNPCLTSEACGRLARALEDGIIITASSNSSTNSTDAYSYCDVDKGAMRSKYLDACLQCVRADGKHRYLSNFLVALDAACRQKPSRGLILGLNDTIFANTSVEGTAPSSPSAPKPSPLSSDDHDGLSAGAIAGIVLGVVALAVLAAGCVFVQCRRRRNRRKKQQQQQQPSSPSPPRMRPPLHPPGAGAAPSPHVVGVTAGPSSSSHAGEQHQQRLQHQQVDDEVDYDGRFFGNDKAPTVAQATFSPVANSKPVAIWPAQAAPQPQGQQTPGGSGRGERLPPLASVVTEPFPAHAHAHGHGTADASPDGATPPTSTVSTTFSSVPLLSNPPYRLTGSPAMGASPIFDAGRRSPVPGQQGRRKKKWRRGSASSPIEATKIQTSFAPPPRG
ncbi:LPXTG-domain-containing protein [Purpureocillium lavendulum]|uniref:LPXTG-domain-containing protein n=1 Tax=Purpureocillium lavendulum TaxID=1247861 RepID=A0AB34FHZ7_9HYPO|nr:LPXTG-domain-containing protein [Purpureocillium lavendulum]